MQHLEKSCKMRKHNRILKHAANTQNTTKYRSFRWDNKWVSFQCPLETASVSVCLLVSSLGSILSKCVVKSGRRFVFCVFACFLKLRYRNYSLKVTGEFSNGVHPMCASLTCPLGLEIGLNPDSTPLQNMLWYIFSPKKSWSELLAGLWGEF